MEHMLQYISTHSNRLHRVYIHALRGTKPNITWRKSIRMPRIPQLFTNVINLLIESRLLWATLLGVWFLGILISPDGKLLGELLRIIFLERTDYKRILMYSNLKIHAKQWEISSRSWNDNAFFWRL